MQRSVLPRILLAHQIEVLFLGRLTKRAIIEIVLCSLDVIFVPIERKIYSSVLEVFDCDIERCLKVVVLHVELERNDLLL